jgi:hypothetical protein
MRLFGGELYYSILWQLMSNEDFLDFAKTHEEDKAVWEETFASAGTSAILKQESQGKTG